MDKLDGVKGCGETDRIEARTILESHDINGNEIPNILVSSQSSSNRKRVRVSDEQLDTNSHPISIKSIQLQHKRQKGHNKESVTTQTNENFYKEQLYGLTTTLWQQIFTLLPPATLARLLRVSQSFRSMLTASSSVLPETTQANLVAVPPSEAIWQRCHRTFAPGLPTPAKGQTELSMWKMIKGTRCQQCGVKKRLQTLSNSQNPESAGPGKDSVRVIWPFLARLCGQCLRDQSLMEKDILLSSIYPSFLMDGLPFTFILESNDCISEPCLRATSLLAGLQPTKIFYKAQVDCLKRQYDSVKEDNPEFLPTWIDSLAETRKEQLKDAERWELWEQKGTLARLNTSPSSRPRVSKGMCNVETSLPGVNKQKPRFSNVIDRDCQNDESYGTSTCGTGKAALQPDLSSFPTRPTDIKDDAGATPSRGSKSFEDAQTALLVRRSDIVRRCRMLDPPISTDILEYMESFHAAMQIAKELDDQQWSILKYRLEAERAEAEVCAQVYRAESGEMKSSAIESSPSFGTISSPNCLSEMACNSTTSAKQPSIVNSADIQAESISQEVRKRLSRYAKEIIDGRWNGGMSLSKDSCSQLAAEVLVHSRKAFYAEDFPREPNPANSNIRLTLESMKWLFETKVKPLTEHHQKEIFLCNGCKDTIKPYGFEAVIQHYAAKHTNCLSLGSIVVHWKCEWPEDPPFHPNPMLLKALAITAATSSQTPVQEENPFTDQEHKLHSSSATISSNSDFHGQGLGIHHLSRHFLEHSKFLSSNVRSDENLTQSQRHGLHVQTLQPSTPRESGPNFIAGHHLPKPFLGPVEGAHFPGQKINTDLTFNRPSLSKSSVPTTDTFRAHQAEMARYARELWFATAGIKGLSGAVRVQTIIHHASERFVGRFQIEPGVNMFLFGLNHESAMRPLRSLNGFCCQACAIGRPGSLPAIDRKNSSTLPHLLNHFMASHAEFHGLDWRKDMIQLPPVQTISELANAPGIDDTKLLLFASTFPQAFPFSIPASSGSRQNAATHQYRYVTGDQDDSLRHYRDKNSEPDATQKSGYSGILPLPSGKLSFGTLDEGEYDPRRPSYVGRMIDNYHGLPTGGKPVESILASPQAASEIGEAERFLEGIRPQLKLGERKFDKTPVQGYSTYHSNTSKIESGAPAKFVPSSFSLVANDGFHASKAHSQNLRLPMPNSKAHHDEDYVYRHPQAYRGRGEVTIYYDTPGCWLPSNALNSETVYRHSEPTCEFSQSPVDDSKISYHHATQHPPSDLNLTPSMKVLPSHEAQSSYTTPLANNSHRGIGGTYGIRNITEALTFTPLDPYPQQDSRQGSGLDFT